MQIYNAINRVLYQKTISFVPKVLILTFQASYELNKLHLLISKDIKGLFYFSIQKLFLRIIIVLLSISLSFWQEVGTKLLFNYLFCPKGALLVTFLK